MDTTDERNVDGLLAANDPLLRPLILSTTEEDRRAALEAVLVGYARPVIRGILAREQREGRLMGAEDAEDIASTVVVHLVRKLQRVPIEKGEAIAGLTDFAAMSTFNAFHDFMRRRFPERTRLKNRVRGVLARDARFRTWTLAGRPACGLASWTESHEAGAIPEAWRHDDRAEPAEAIESLLRSCDKPLLVEDVVRALAAAWNITDGRDVAGPEIADRAASHAEQIEGRRRLEAIWRETRALPAQQRTALLLNLRDPGGGNALVLFVLMGIATLDEVAAAIDLPVTRLASLWSRLPLDDQTVASLLGVTRQRVINLRLAARQRLARRLRKW